MDPIAALWSWAEAHAEGRYAVANDIGYDYYQWVARGGFLATLPNGELVQGLWADGAVVGRTSLARDCRTLSAADVLGMRS
jgi:hypothetical protein